MIGFPRRDQFIGEKHKNRFIYESWSCRNSKLEQIYSLWKINYASKKSSFNGLNVNKIWRNSKKGLKSVDNFYDGLSKANKFLFRQKARTSLLSFSLKKLLWVYEANFFCRKDNLIIQKWAPSENVILVKVPELSDQIFSKKMQKSCCNGLIKICTFSSSLSSFGTLDVKRTIFRWWHTTEKVMQKF